MNHFRRQQGRFRRLQSGLTLVEAVIALALFGMLAAGVVWGSLFSRKLAEEALRENTAAAVAKGYAEQIKSMVYARIQDSLANPDIALPTEIDQGTPDPIYLPGASASLLASNNKQVALNLDASGNPTEVMNVRVTPEIVDMQPLNGLQMVAISVTIEWDSSTRLASAARRSFTVRTARSTVQNL